MRICGIVVGCLALVALSAPAGAQEALVTGLTVAPGGPVDVATTDFDRDYLLDSGSLPVGSGRTVSGDAIAGGWDVFQPFTVPEPGWDVETIGTDGWVVQDPLGKGMLGLLHPDDGSGMPDMEDVLGSGVYFLGSDSMSSHWVDEEMDVILPAGDYWMHWLDNGDPNFWAAIFEATSGFGSQSYSGGSFYPAGPTALRIAGEIVPEPVGFALLALGGLVALRRSR